MSSETRPFEKTITAGYSDTFSGREVRPTSMMAFLEETAAEHCRSIGRDLFSLLEHGGGWVLTGGGMRMDRYPRYGETFRIRTWISRWKAFIGIREYRIVSDSGEVLGEAGGRWVYWDLQTRKPTRVPDVFRREWFFNEDSPYRRITDGAAAASPVLPFIADGTVFRSGLEVRRVDVDLYGHLHNTTYMDWLLESVPENLWSGAKPMDMSLKFHGEATLGDSVEFATRREGERWIHEVRRESDGRLLVTGASLWSGMPAAASA